MKRANQIFLGGKSRAFVLVVVLTAYLGMLFNSCSSCSKDVIQDDGELKFVSFDNKDNQFAIVSEDATASLLIDSSSSVGVQKVLYLFQQDVLNVTSTKLNVVNTVPKDSKNVVLVGVVGECKFLKQLEEVGKINLDEIKGKWENSLIVTVENPFPGVDNAIVVAGSDKRGAIFGLFELSKQMGVSPWYWWADVPVESHQEVYVKAGSYNLGEPKVQYRGIFLNDEEPALGPWVRETFGGFNAQFYDKVFELILRMKGNYLWPAMWGKAFADDDPKNAILADEYGVVIGYSHHEPMMRSHKEWSKYGEGDWNYVTNKKKLQEFWREGIQRNLGKESLVTVGMRGDGDEPMSEDRNIDLLTQIVQDQRRIIEEETGMPANEVPQVWALYKEVQEYYDKGMRVDDDITLLYCDDNWGNVRRLPTEKERVRKGGSGMYYHFDYVGGPRSYKWINTNHLPKIWEQNKLTYDYGGEKLWVVNVGDLKPMELPIQFYLDLAWDPDKMDISKLKSYTKKWAAQQFGKEYSVQIGSILDRYGKYSSRIKPEQLNMFTYSSVNYKEFECVTNELNELCKEVLDVESKLNDKYKDAYFQLVKYPVEALSNLYNLYHVQAKNNIYYHQKRSATNLMADSVAYYFKRDSILKLQYHQDISGGKWNHMMNEIKTGYRSWNTPRKEIMPKVNRLVVKSDIEPQIYVEGTEINDSTNAYELPEFDVFKNQTYFFEIFNKGCQEFDFKLKPAADWIKTSVSEGKVIDEKRIYVTIDWSKAPKGNNSNVITVNAEDKEYKVGVKIFNPSQEVKSQMKGFVESNGYISIEASDYTSSLTDNNFNWMTIPDIGLTGDGVTIIPRLYNDTLVLDSTFLEYNVWMKSPGKVKVYAYFSPTLNFKGGEGLKYGMSLNDETPEVVNVHDQSTFNWGRVVTDNLNICLSEHEIKESGNNTLKFHVLSPGLVLQKIVIDAGGLKRTKLGPDATCAKSTL
ncbi:glycosyl hydrolase 115 family protein [Plebeiibacterium sediminum]|uniref:Glycosyl hydrolase 115 family protein n=1 Tax=Plebeiibacterium sediminum TaxID=2992112 RepID=A0AAE3M4K7_9BACT|nr:glycosyl hydrolase 115 family protein [Plebeiobacterium sediminum]MCW3786710.1 glycosyl hydrolase 115 family protein [Plebeiobacterium sediminum]